MFLNNGIKRKGSYVGAARVSVLAPVPTAIRGLKLDRSYFNVYATV